MYVIMQSAWSGDRLWKGTVIHRVPQITDYVIYSVYYCVTFVTSYSSIPCPICKHDVTFLRSAHGSATISGSAAFTSHKRQRTNLELQTDRFHVVHRPIHSSQWTKGRSLNTASHVYVHVQSKNPY